MKSIKFASTVAFILVMSGVVSIGTAKAQESFSLEAIDSAPKADSVSDALAQQFAGSGYRVKNGSRTICELWLAKQWDIDPSFKASKERLYPFQQGQLIGLVHFSRKYSDFRKQTIPGGWYTLRFGLQPVDGNHEGTSIIRDFLLLINVAQDAGDKKWETKDLFKASAESIGTTHPAMLSLQLHSKGATASVVHEAEKEFQILHLVGKGVAGTKTEPTPLDFVVAGHAPE